MRICFVLGTRPEFIKMAPIIQLCEELGLNFFTIHTGQHYSYNMDSIFFKQLNLPEPDYKLNIGSGGHGEQTGRMLIGIEKILRMERPDIVLVQGDTNTTLAGALVSTKLGIKVGHVEAGLRSYDRTMPEEINRTLVDHCSDLLFAPTEISRCNLLNEGIPDDKIFVCGNTIVDVIYQKLKLIEQYRGVLNFMELKAKEYFLTTIHRQENVNDDQRFSRLLKGMEYLHEEFGLPIIYPIHPRSEDCLRLVNFKSNGIKVIEALDYLSFLQLERYARLILTDSGGVQEEACILGVPCVTLRNNTERPETINVGANILAGTDPKDIIEKTKLMLSKNIDWSNPLGDGNASKRIIDAIINNFEN